MGNRRRQAFQNNKKKEKKNDALRLQTIGRSIGFVYVSPFSLYFLFLSVSLYSTSSIFSVRIDFIGEEKITNEFKARQSLMEKNLYNKRKSYTLI